MALIAGAIMVLVVACDLGTSSPPTTAAPHTTTTSPLQTDASQPTTTSPDQTDGSPPLASLVSADSVFSYLEDLTTIQPYSGWRNSATEGEAEAFDYVAETLGDFAYLNSIGLELERQSFNVFLATELWDTQLFISIDGQEQEVPADAPRGHRHDVKQALRFDSDGVLNDSDRNPVDRSAEVVMVGSAADARELEADTANGAIAFVDYAILDPAAGSPALGVRLVTDLIEDGAAGIVLVTSFSESADGSHGFLAGDGQPVEGLTTERTPPLLYVRLEDFADAGIETWDDLAKVETARVIWDTDVFSPGSSGNLVARIPGADTSQAVILGAHLDSPNSPGAIDNGVNSAVLLEVASVLNGAQQQPASDLYLVWFGSEELWLYGSQHFVNTHQELLDRTVGGFFMDAIVGATSERLLWADGRSHSRFGDDRLLIVDYVAEIANSLGIAIEELEDIQGIASDNTVFSGFVPQSGFSFSTELGDYPHSPYGTADAVAELAEVVEQVASVALTVALETGRELPELRATPEPEHRALLVASHTEVLHMTPTMLIDFDRALAWEGFDVDVIPHAAAFAADELASSDLVVALPVIDYPSPPGGNVDLYDEAWADHEIDALVTYVDEGGLLVLPASASRVVFGMVFDENEDWADVNPLAERFGVVFEEGDFSSAQAEVKVDHPLTVGVPSLSLTPENGVPSSLASGTVLADIDGIPVAAIVDYGEAGGQVLVLADVAMLGFVGPTPDEPENLDFLLNLADYAARR